VLTALRDVAELVRLPAACTVPGDVLAGAAATGFRRGRRTAWLPVASVCLYCGGMALNDWADRETDAVERPERPIPSGRIGPGRALGVAGVLTCAGLVAALAGGGRDAVVPAAAVAVTAWTYDLVLKPTAAGPLGMAAARALNVLVGAGVSGARQALPQAAAVGAHTLALTVLSRGEVHGTGLLAPGAALIVTAGLATALVTRGGPAPRGFPWTAALAAAHAAGVAPGYLRAARSRAPAAVRQAVAGGILGLIPLQAALLSRAGARRASVAVAALYLVGRPAARRMATT
jgi:UbiA prenyltransferase family